MERQRVSGPCKQGPATDTSAGSVAGAQAAKWRGVVLLLIAASLVIAGCDGNNRKYASDKTEVASPTSTSTVAPAATLTLTVTPRGTDTPPAHTPASPGESPTPTATPTPLAGSPTPRIEGACFVGAPPCTGTSTLTTRDDCCEFSRTSAGPLPVGWCAERDLNPETLACAACSEPCDGQPTFTPTTTPTASPMPTPSVSPCDVTNPCPQGAFCELPTGVCATNLDSGMCVEVPLICLDVFEPVCGCDGLTYGNDCLRRAARVQNASDGACSEEECSDACDCYATRTFATSCPLECASCGNFWTCEKGSCLEHCGIIPLDACDRICSANDTCGESEFCRKPVGQCTGLGACGARPTGCPDNVDPVCGCDGQTYSNDCDAADAGVAVDHRGACTEVCGTLAGLSCPKGEFCEFPADMCGVLDLGGECLEVPETCLAIIDPVCACDGSTYENNCQRQRARAQLDHPGPCRSGE